MRENPCEQSGNNPPCGGYSAWFSAWLLKLTFRMYIAPFSLAFKNTNTITTCMNIPYYIIKDAPKSCSISMVADWVRGNDHLISLVASHIQGRLHPSRPGTVGRPRIDRGGYAECLRGACLGVQNAKPRKEVIAMMREFRPLSDTAGREILQQLQEDGLVGSSRGEFSWSPTMVWWVDAPPEVTATDT